MKPHAHDSVSAAQLILLQLVAPPAHGRLIAVQREVLQIFGGVQEVTNAQGWRILVAAIGRLWRLPTRQLTQTESTTFAERVHGLVELWQRVRHLTLSSDRGYLVVLVGRGQ